VFSSFGRTKRGGLLSPPVELPTPRAKIAGGGGYRGCELEQKGNWWGARVVILTNYADFNDNDTVLQYRQIVDEVTQARDESFKKATIALRLECVIRKSGKYLANVPASVWSDDFVRLLEQGLRQQLFQQCPTWGFVCMLETEGSSGASPKGDHHDGTHEDHGIHYLAGPRV